LAEIISASEITAAQMVSHRFAIGGVIESRSASTVNSLNSSRAEVVIIRDGVGSFTAARSGFRRLRGWRRRRDAVAQYFLWKGRGKDSH